MICFVIIEPSIFNMTVPRIVTDSLGYTSEKLFGEIVHVALELEDGRYGCSVNVCPPDLLETGCVRSREINEQQYQIVCELFGQENLLTFDEFKQLKFKNDETI
jgi:hypothetical protein